MDFRFDAPNVNTNALETSQEQLSFFVIANSTNVASRDIQFSQGIYGIGSRTAGTFGMALYGCFALGNDLIYGVKKVKVHGSKANNL
jgi:hypothetical protein